MRAEPIDWDALLAIEAAEILARETANETNTYSERDELERRLTVELEEVAKAVMGPSNTKSRHEWRWGSQSGRVLTLSGPHRGRFKDFDSDAGGGPLTMIAYGLADSPPTPADHARAVAWARNYLGLGDGPVPLPDADMLARHAESQQRREDEAKIRDQMKIAGAQSRHYHSVAPPLVVDLYLTQTRKIPKPDGGWPSAIRYCPNDRALLMPLITDDGTITAIQLVYLTSDGRKREVHGRSKDTRGVMAGAYIRLRARQPGCPLAICEGPETGISVWVATGWEVWIVCGNPTRATPPPDRDIVICCDDDARTAPSKVNLDKGLASRFNASRTRIVYPWSVRRYDKSDFNDVMQAGGIDAVRQALGIDGPPTPKPKRKLLTLKEGEQQTKSAVHGFFEKAATFKPGDPPIQHAINTPTGIGKSADAREAAAIMIRLLRQAGDERTIVFAVPMHKLATEAKTRFADDITVGTWQGRDTLDPESTTGDLMCHRIEDVKAATKRWRMWRRPVAVRRTGRPVRKRSNAHSMTHVATNGRSRKSRMSGSSHMKSSSVRSRR